MATNSQIEILAKDLKRTRYAVENAARLLENNGVSINDGELQRLCERTQQGQESLIAQTLSEPGMHISERLNLIRFIAGRK